MDESIVIIGLVVWLVLGIVGDWMLFSKAGRSGILSLIPGVNMLVEYSICWSGWIGLINFLLLGGVTYIYDSETAAPAGIAGLIVVILHWVESQKLARCFGKGFVYGLFLFFFDRIGRVCLGLSSAKYIGKT